MSLDVFLKIQGTKNKHYGSGIFIRKNGQTKEISREEWDKKFPGCEPVVAKTENESDVVYNANITHNLGVMALHAGIYQYLWRPDELGIKYANELIEPLQTGLKLLMKNPKKFKQFNPSNGWGNYEVLVNFVDKYLEACKTFPMAEISVSR